MRYCIKHLNKEIILLSSLLLHPRRILTEHIMLLKISHYLGITKKKKLFVFCYIFSRLQLHVFFVL